GADQKISCFDIVAVAGPMKRGCPIGVGRVHICSLFQQGTHRTTIDVFSSVDQRRPGTSCREEDEEDQQAERHLNLRQRVDVQLTCTAANLLDGYAEFVHECQQKVRIRGAVLILHVASTLEGSCATANQHEWKITA